MHFLIPLVILLVVYPNVDKKLAFALAFLTLAPDLDFFIDFTHRYLFHSIFFPMITGLIIYLFARSMKIFLISVYYLTSHLILDMSTGAVALFWPLYQRLIEFDISLNTRWVFEFSIRTHPLSNIRDHMIAYPSYFFTREGIIIASFILMLLAVRYRKDIIKYLRR